MATVVLENVRKEYPFDNSDKKKKRREKTPEKKNNLEIVGDKVVAVQDFSLEIKDREFVVLVGPSGCGKSTTLRMIAGLEEITDGSIYIDGKLVNDIEPKDRDIAMVFQNYALYPHMSVYDNMAFSLKTRKVPKEDIDRIVREAADILDITPLLDRKPKALSGGQRQRVAIGRAFVRNPKVFLMDEPLSNLDAKLRNQMRAEIIKLRDKIDTTFIYVTHDQVEAMTLGDRIVIMKDGFIQQIGTPQEVFNHPYNEFVAGFIGVPQMNFFRDCDLTEKDGIYSVDVQGKTYDLTDAQCAALAENGVAAGKVTVGIRPVNISVRRGPDSGNCIPAVVEVSEMMGSEVHIHMNAGGVDVVAIVSTDNAGEEEFRSRSEVSFDLNPRWMHLFDKETGENLIP
ncbi:MAG: sn-glycerol-3-phosphate ABC transporter ATP-binding protein UgpC [Firmicutes bacterium]|nr:sn-glycerol-3-phosphate ABC transporter ATP-binding protein UgpC [Bacillota bacterium]